MSCCLLLDLLRGGQKRTAVRETVPLDRVSSIDLATFFKQRKKNPAVWTYRQW
jgi:hypothetical protein